jgi:hypothetical protein
LKVSLEFGRLDGAIFGSEVLEQVETGHIAELKQRMRNGANVDPGDGVKKLLTESIVDGNKEIENVSIVLMDAVVLGNLGLSGANGKIGWRGDGNDEWDVADVGVSARGER